MRRNIDPSTSHESAEAIEAKTPHLERVVMEAIKAFGPDGCICDELMKPLAHLDKQTVSPRFKPLREKGLIYWNGDKRCGNTTRKQMVLRWNRRSKPRDAEIHYQPSLV